MEVCKHQNWSPIAYPDMMDFNTGLKPFSEQHIFRVTSIYDVYCNDCKKFVSLLDGKEIEPGGRVVLNLK